AKGDPQAGDAQLAVLHGDPDIVQVGCQASGSIPIFPSAGTVCGTPGGNPGSLAVGQEKDIAITVTNTSSTVPLPGTPVAATLRGTITFTLACTDTICGTQLPATLNFVPVGGNGCVSSDPGVASCTSIDANHVAITMTSTGVALAP